MHAKEGKKTLKKLGRNGGTVKRVMWNRLPASSHPGRKGAESNVVGTIIKDWDAVVLRKIKRMVRRRAQRKKKGTGSQNGMGEGGGH